MDTTLPTRMQGDNSAAIMLSKTPMFHKENQRQNSDDSLHAGNGEEISDSMGTNWYK